MPKAEDLSACFGLRKWSGAVSGVEPRRSSKEQCGGKKEGVIMRIVSI